MKSNYHPTVRFISTTSIPHGILKNFKETTETPGRDLETDFLIKSFSEFDRVLHSVGVDTNSSNLKKSDLIKTVNKTGSYLSELTEKKTKLFFENERENIKKYFSPILMNKIRSKEYYLRAYLRWKRYIKEIKINNWEKLGLSPKLLPFLKSTLGFPLVPTKIQKDVIPVIINGEDVAFHSSTGSGKTFAYLLPLLTNLVEKNTPRSVRVVILVNSHGLAVQTYNVVREFVGNNIVYFATGMMEINKITKQIVRKKPLILIVTPNTFWSILEVPGLVDAVDVNHFVIDEVDHTLRSVLKNNKIIESKNIKPIVKILKLAAKKSRNAQIIVCSATYSEKVVEILNKIKNKDKNMKVFVSYKDHSTLFSPVSRDVEHFFVVGYYSNYANRLELFLKTYRKENPNSALLIVPEQSFNITSLMKDLLSRNLKAENLNESDYLKTERSVILEKFENGNIKLAVTSEYFHRGLNFEFVSHVFFWDLVPKDNLAELYVHISGRLARPMTDYPFLKTPGRCISFVDYKNVIHLKELEKRLKIKFTNGAS